MNVSWAVKWFQLGTNIQLLYYKLNKLLFLLVNVTIVGREINRPKAQQQQI
jgi:hypothetical protein